MALFAPAAAAGAEGFYFPSGGGSAMASRPVPAAHRRGARRGWTMDETDDFSETLNPEQRAAVTAPDGPVLVLAAAGTGKTRTLTYRVAWLVRRGLDARRMLLLTFTNRAAREMLERAEKLVGAAVGGIWGGTFHHLCNRLLRRHAPLAGYRNDYTILDQDDSRSLMRACVNELGLRDKHFPKPDVLLARISLAANKAVPLEDVLQAHFDEKVTPLEPIRRVAAAYAARKREINAMDFDDLLVQAVALLDQHPHAREEYADRFRHVLVDEYQDTNPLQARLVDALAEKHGNLFVVGDDFQSIYAWRGADFRNFLSFPKRYPATQIYKLETNYRSVPGILSVANACIAGNPEQFQKTLRPVREDPRRPVLAQLRDGEQQARYIVGKIRECLDAGYALSDIAVLYRAHYHAMELQLQLSREQVPYRITSGVRFFEQAHVKDVVAPLRLLINPGDELAFLRWMQLLPRIGERSALKIWAGLGRRFDPADAAQRQALADALPAAAREDWKALSEEVFAPHTPEECRQTPALVAEDYVDVFYKKIAAENFENADNRLDDVAELINYIGKFADLSSFLNEVALQTNLEAEAERPEEEEAPKALLSTIHQAKGLEWKVVFILWMAEGMFPSSRSMDDPDQLSEERRLFYVASTRARDVLFLCQPQMRLTRDQGVCFYSPSRFIREIPAKLLTLDRQKSFS